MKTALRFQGPHGAYDVGVPQSEDTPIDVVYGDKKMRWTIEVMDDAGGKASGLTSNTEAIWGEVFWFELVVGPPAHIAYYATDVIVRTDYEAKP